LNQDVSGHTEISQNAVHMW